MRTHLLHEGGKSRNVIRTLINSCETNETYSHVYVISGAALSLARNASLALITKRDRWFRNALLSKPILYAATAETELISLFQRLIAELNKEQEAFIASKQAGEKVEAVAPWVGAPNEDALREECLSLSTVSHF